MATSETSTQPETAKPRSGSGTMSAVQLTIVVPAYNESGRIGASMDRIWNFVRDASLDAEVLVVDDGSSDGTADIVARLNRPGFRSIRNPENRGKGYAVRTGVLAARGEYVLFSDADLSSPIEEFHKLMAAAQHSDADVVVGSRALNRKLIEIHQSPLREAGGVVFNKIVRVLLGLPIHDTQCGFKLFKRRAVAPVFEKLTIEGFGFDPELLFLSARAGLKIVEVPVRWSHADGSKVRFLRDATRMFTDLVRIRWNSLTGRYS